jgi:hypothetical protein
VNKFRPRGQTISALAAPISTLTARNKLFDTMESGFAGTESWRSPRDRLAGGQSIAAKVNPRFMQSLDLGSLDEAFTKPSTAMQTEESPSKITQGGKRYAKLMKDAFFQSVFSNETSNYKNISPTAIVCTSDTLIANKNINKYQDEKDRITQRHKGVIVSNKIHT